MIVRRLEDLHGSEREVHGPDGAYPLLDDVSGNDGEASGARS